MWWSRMRQRETWVQLGIAALIRGALFLTFIHEHGLYGAWYGWGLDNGDTAGYFQPIESFLNGNAYRPDYRTPGYGFIYLLFRLFTTPQGAGTLILFAQLVLGILSVVVLARCAKLLGAGTRSRYIACVSYALFGSVAVYDIQWFTESFCTSALILGVHGWLAHRRGGPPVLLFWSGGWLAWAVMLRPVQAIALLILALATLLLTSGGWRRKVLFSLFLLTPFLLVDGWWVRRNHIMHGTFTPLSPGTIPPEMVRSPMYTLMRFLQATGGNYLYWDPRADIRWLNMRDGPLGRPGPRQDRDVRLPAFALSARITADSLRMLGDDMARWSDATTTPEERNRIFRRMDERSHRFCRYFQEDRPFAYHVGARFRMAGRFYERAGWMPLFHDPPKVPVVPSMLIRAIDGLLYQFAVIGGLLASVMAMSHRRKRPERAVLAVLVLCSVLVIPFGLRLCEARYLVPMLPWLLLLPVLTLADRSTMPTPE